MTNSQYESTLRKLAEFQAEKDFADAMDRVALLSKKGHTGRYLLPVQFEIRVISAESRNGHITHDEKVVVNLRNDSDGRPTDTGNDEASLMLLRIVNAVRLLANVANSESLERLEAFQLPAPVADALASSPCSDVPA